MDVNTLSLHEQKGLITSPNQARDGVVFLKPGNVASSPLNRTNEITAENCPVAESVGVKRLYCNKVNRRLSTKYEKYLSYRPSDSAL